MKQYIQIYNSPVGKYYIIASDEALIALDRKKPEGEYSGNDITEMTVRQLDEYFAGKRKIFNIPLSFSGTDFQKKAWQALLEIPYGETRSYAQNAQAIGNPKAARAIGNANNKNPISIIIPCHRVIHADGCLGGYTGGVEVKKFLLYIEKRYR